ncbi:MAG TPA: HAMP domain-containing sensor histidine kinase [Anaeromyxobacteraceae bacterium]|nr:HAMP domain-containing sensor histidine kinase [Anaeromyxobacteraceae bacterium]
MRDPTHEGSTNEVVVPGSHPPGTAANPHASRPALLLAFLVVVLALALVDIVVLLAADPELQSLRDIADMHARALKVTTHIRGHLLDIRQELFATLRVGRATVVAPDVAQAFAHLGRDAEALLSLAATRPDRSEAGMLRAALTRCEEESRSAAAEVGRSNGAPAHLRLEALLDATRSASEAADQIVSSNADAVEQLARRIRVHLRWTILAATFLSVMGAAAVLLLQHRLLRSFSAERAAASTRSVELECFAARAAHELRNPLQTVSLALRALEHGDQAHALERAQRSTDRLRDTVDDLLQFARAGITPEATSPADVSSVIGEVQDELAPQLAAANVAMNVHVPPGTSVAMANVHLAIVLRNVVGNAVKYSTGAERACVTICATPGRADVHLEVSDNGPGIPAEALPRLFEPFFRATTRSSGHGLGLATVRRLVEAHRGAVRITSAPGVGTKVELDLPRGSTLADARESRAPCEPVRRG